MEREEFKRVWLPLSGRMYRVAFSILGSESDAKDAVQDLYVRLWNIRDSLGRVENPVGYGIRLMRNICIDRLRAKDVRGNPEDLSSVSDRCVSEVPADKPMIDRETVASLRSAMERLPDNQKKVFEMKFFRQLDYDEISGMTGLSNVNIRVLISRARNTVISLMKGSI